MKSLIRSLALLSAIGLSAAHAQPPRDGELLRQARRDRELATQKAESDLRNTLRDARTKSPADALAAMKKLLNDIEANAILDSVRKTDMVKELQSRIRETDAIVRSRGEKAGTPSSSDQIKAKKEALRAELDRQEAERQKIATAITEVDKLVGQGRTQEADRRAQEIAKEFPKNPVGKIMSHQGTIRANLRDAKDLIANARKSYETTLKAISESAILPAGDLAYNVDIWKQINNSKHRGNGKPLTEKEQAILKAMNKTITPDFKGAKFDSVIEALQTALGTTIVIDPKAKEENNITSDSLVNFSLPREISTRTALRKVLLDAGLGYVVKDEMIYVTTLAKTREMMTTRAYYIGDITTQNPLQYPLPGQMQEAENLVVKGIVDSIKRSVDPMSWEQNASIHYDPVTKALIVRQSAEVHMLLRSKW